MGFCQLFQLEKKFAVLLNPEMTVVRSAAVFDGHLALRDVDREIFACQIDMGIAGDEGIVPALRVCGKPAIDGLNGRVGIFEFPFENGLLAFIDGQAHFFIHRQLEVQVAAGNKHR